VVTRNYLENGFAACFPSSPPFSQAEKGENPPSLWERDRARGILEIASNEWPFIKEIL
jgi:hypothetical protein